MEKANADVSPAPASGSQPSHLCEACLSVLARDDLEGGTYYPHHRSLNSFLKAALEGCYHCEHRLANLDIDDQENLVLLATGKTPDEGIGDITESAKRFSDPAESVARFQGLHGQTISRFSFSVMNLRWFGGYWKMYLAPNPIYEAYIPPQLGSLRSSLNKLWHKMIEAPWIVPQQEYKESGLPEDLPSNTGSSETWATIHRWLQECSENHQCLANINQDWYPTRLVEILPDNTWRIVRSDSKSFRRTHGYLTLSHRWGNGDFARLTTENLPAFEKGQPMPVLRKIFQEALAAAQRIGIPYVWIDSLCIIQDGDGGADWRQESILMAEVYSNSRCNLSADWGDDYNGLFYERFPPFQKPTSIKVQVKSPEASKALAHDTPAYVVHQEALMEDVMEAPLNRRGWVVQERILAPRVLHFTPFQVSWECIEKLSSERVPLNFKTQRSTRILASLDFNSRHANRMERLKLNEPQDAVHWPRVVSYYSSCGLTKVQDKLVAIAGVAKTLRPVVKDRYVAGLWERSLPISLLWHRSGRSESWGPSAQYFAPTFSWAASDGETQLADEGDFPDSRIIAAAAFIKHRTKSPGSSTAKDAVANPTDEELPGDVFGPLVSPEAELRMRGILRSCARVPPLPDPHEQPYSTSVCPSVGIKDPNIQAFLDNGTVLDVTDDRAAAEGDPKPDSYLYYFTAIERSIVHPAPDEFSGQNGYNHVTGLLLRSVDASMGRFERVGRVEYLRGRGAGDVLQPLGNEADLPAWSYDKATGEHTWYIV